MKTHTITIKFTRDFYSPIPRKKFFVAADPKNNTLDIDVDEENFPIHSFWQDIFRFNDISPTVEIVSEVTPDNKPKKK